MLSYLISFLGFLLFAIVHTISANPTFKTKVFSIFPSLPRYYRLLFSLGSAIYLLAWYLLLPIPAFVFYQFDGSLYFIFRLIQLVAILGLSHSVLISYPSIFIGFHQLKSFRKMPFRLDEPAFLVKLRIDSIYSFVRHPMYFWTLIYLFFQPIVTDRSIFLTLCFWLYFYLGSFPEEKKLVQQFGENYLRYKKEVPRLFPFSLRKTIKHLFK